MRTRVSKRLLSYSKVNLRHLNSPSRRSSQRYLYGLGGGNDPNGLALLIPDDPTVGSLAGVDRATEVQWRSRSYDFAGTLNATNIEEAYDDVLLDLKQGTERPKVIITGRNHYRLYRAAVRC